MVSKVPTVLARVLTHIPGLGVLCGHLLSAPEAHLKPLADAGLVDMHPDAVAYAQTQKAKVVQLTDPDTAAELGAAMQDGGGEVKPPAADGTAAGTVV